MYDIIYILVCPILHALDVFYFDIFYTFCFIIYFYHYFSLYHIEPEDLARNFQLLHIYLAILFGLS